MYDISSLRVKHDKTEHDVSQTCSFFRQNGWKMHLFIFFDRQRYFRSSCPNFLTAIFPELPVIYFVWWSNRVTPMENLLQLRAAVS